MAHVLEMNTTEGEYFLPLFQSQVPVLSSVRVSVYQFTFLTITGRLQN